MNGDCVVEAPIRTTKNILWETFHPLIISLLPLRLGEYASWSTVQSALERISDTVLKFALQAVGQVVANQSQTDRKADQPPLSGPGGMLV
jgi:hypothetical protein